MNMLARLNGEPAPVPAQLVPERDLEALLDDLSSVGKPRLSRHEGGWYAVVEMATSALGSEFNVRSDFNHPTPRHAAAQCLERVHAALQQMGRPAP